MDEDDDDDEDGFFEKGGVAALSEEEALRKAALDCAREMEAEELKKTSKLGSDDYLMSL